MTNTHSFEKLVELRDALRAKRTDDLKQARLISIIGKLGIACFAVLGLFGFLGDNLGFGLFMMLLAYLALKWVTGALVKQAEQAAHYKHDLALQSYLSPIIKADTMELTSYNSPFWRHFPKTILPNCHEVETAGHIQIEKDDFKFDFLDIEMKRRVADEPSIVVFRGILIECELTDQEYLPLIVRPRKHHDRNALIAPYAEMQPAKEIVIANLPHFEGFCDDRDLAENTLSKKFCLLFENNPTLALHLKGTTLHLIFDKRQPLLGGINVNDDYQQTDIKSTDQNLTKLIELTSKVCAQFR